MKVDSGPGPLVLLVEDDVELGSYLRVKLSQAGFRVMLAETAAGGLVLARESNPSIVVANVDLPHGRDIVTRLERTGVPLILLTGLQGGRVPFRDVEVLRKPFLVHELLELLRVRRISASCLSAGAVRLDVKVRLLTVAEVPVPVSAKEFELLLVLMRRPRRVYSAQELTGAIWPDQSVGPNSLTALATTVRRKVAEAGQPGFIRTVRGFGYGLST